MPSEQYMGWEQIAESAAFLKGLTERSPRVMLITGSGLGGLADEVQGATIVPYEDVPHFVPTSVPGHAGRLVLGELAGLGVALMHGRIHFYEGYSLQRITFPIRVLHRLGAEILIVTNAAGGLCEEWHAGDLMLITDHVNLVGMAGLNPLRGPNDERLGPRFVDMSIAYDRRLREMALSAAAELRIELRQGIYVMSGGPTFETPADVRFLRQIGADAVGMSTVPEVVVARHEDMKVLGISHISNVIPSSADPETEDSGSTEGLHQEVLDAGSRVMPKLKMLITRIIERLEEY